MTNIFKYCNNVSKKYDVYLFVFCNEYKRNIEIIQKLLDIKNIPKTMFSNFKIENDFEKKLYTDKFEIIFYGIKKIKKCDSISLYDKYGEIGKKIFEEYKNKKILINLISDDINNIKNEVASFILGYYKFIELKTNKIKDNNEIYFYIKNKKYNHIINGAIYEANVQNEIRNLINLPANILNSTRYVNYIKKNISQEKNIKIKIFDEKQLKKIGCNLILSVNQGSKNKPYMVILEYKNGINKSNDKPIVMIGKGVMFDSGGYNLKHGDFSDMKNDMTGSAIVYGTMKLISHFNIEGHYIGILILVENMIGQNAARPGDIVKSYINKTVEIVDTDAEGRLILADGLGYARNFNPYLCIDIGTLVQQASNIFSNKVSIVMGNNNKYIQKVLKSGKDNNEKFWEIPMWKEYVELTTSDIADLKNYNIDNNSKTLMAGAFLYNFVPEKSNWIHFDIAGPDYLYSNTLTRNYGATGISLRTLFDFIKDIDKEIYEK